MRIYGFVSQKECIMSEIPDENPFSTKQENEGVQFYATPVKDCFFNPEERPELWKINIVNKFFPFWYKEDAVKKRCTENFTLWWNKHVIINKEIPKINSGFFLLKNCKVLLLRNAIVDAYDTKIDTVKGKGKVRIACGTTQIDSLLEKSRIELLKDRSFVGIMTNTSSIHTIQDHAYVVEMRLHSKIDIMKNNAMIEQMKGNSCIVNMQGGFVKKIIGNGVSISSTGIEAYIASIS